MPHHHHPPFHPPDPPDLSELWLLREILWTLREILYVDNQILFYVKPPNATKLHIGALTMIAFDPGATGIVLQADFLPVGSTAPNPGFTVAWTDSNSFCSFVNDSTDTTGLTQDVVVSASATVGTTGVITATLTGTFPDGSAAALTGTFNYTIGAPPIGNATSLRITQIA